MNVFTSDEDEEAAVFFADINEPRKKRSVSSLSYCW